MTQELTKERLASLYTAFTAHAPWKPWFDSYSATARHFADLPAAALRTPAEQEKLWRATGISSIGPGEAVNTEGAYTDPEIVEALASVRDRHWPDEPGKRSRAVQDAYDNVLDLVHPKHSSQKPQAKLGRVFAALLPAHTNTCLNWKSQRNVTRLVVGQRKVDPLEGAVLVRHRLRSVLGPEADLTEHVRRSQFCWWLHEHIDTIQRGETPSAPDGAKGTTEVDYAPSKLTVAPHTAQRMGLTSVAGYVDTYRQMVKASQNGAIRDDVIETFLQESTLAPNSARIIFNDVRWLGFLAHKGTLVEPSEDGEQLLAEDPPDLLVQKMLERVFGMAWGLRFFAQGPMQPAQFYPQLRDLYPAWQSDVMPSNVASWLEGLGLLERTSGYTRQITEYGKAWHARLPEELPRPPIPSAAPIDAEVPAAEGPKELSPPTLDALRAAFAADPLLTEFVVDAKELTALHLAWHAHRKKRFVILSGLSGTGKTALLLHYARIYCDLMSVPVEEHRTLVPVSPDWRDPSGLLGYLNKLHTDATFQAEPALRLLVRASRDPGHPYFLLLDEMNLARVEQYFAPFLSAMETGHELVLHTEGKELNGVPDRVAWPRNLFIGGTVNMDETTHPFSDKVLDRAFTLEFFDVDLGQFLDRRANAPGRVRDAETEKLLHDLHEALRPIRRHFGYRTAGEVLEFVEAAGDGLSAEARWHLVDQSLFSKILPRLRGEETPALRKAMATLLALCDGRLPRSYEKIRQMQERLVHTSLTRFWS